MLFNKTTDLPTAVNTVESLMLWTSYVMQQNFQGRTTREVGGIVDIPLCQVWESYSPQDANIVIIRAALQRPSNFAELSTKLWLPGRVGEWSGRAGSPVQSGFTS